MKSGTDERFHSRRKQYRGIVSDQGTEKGVADMTLDIVPRYRQDVNSHSFDAFVFPCCIGSADMLHIIYDALEVACKRCCLYKPFLDRLRVLTGFVTDKQIVNKFKATCFTSNPTDGKSFTVQKRTHIDWKWEFMSNTLDNLMPSFATMKKHFDLKLLVSSDSGTDLSNQTLKLTQQVIQADDFEPSAEMYRVLGKTCEKYAGLLETCDCHENIWKAPRRGRKRRLSQLRKDTNREGCCMQTRRLPWLIAVGKRACLSELRLATSERLQLLLASLPSDRRSKIVAALEELRTDIIETIVAKLVHLDHAPFAAIGAFYSEQGGDIERSKELLRLCVGEFDANFAEDGAIKMHRIAWKLFHKDSVVRDRIDDFLDGSEPLRHYRALYSALLELALIPATARRVEETHARIRRIGLQALGVGLPYVCALLRSEFVLDKLFKHNAFMDFCCKRWRSRKIADEILQLRYPQKELKDMSNADKIARVYQTGIDEEFQDMGEARNAYAFWRITTADTRAATTELSDVHAQCAIYLKSVLEKGCFFSFPKGLMDMSCAAPPADYPRGLLERAFDCVDSAPDCVFDHTTMLIVRIINNNPGSRVLVHVHHLPAYGEYKVTCLVCKMFGSGRLGNRRLLITQSSDQLTFDVRPLVANIAHTLTKVYKWQLKASKAVPRLRDFDAPTFAVHDENALPLPSPIEPALLLPSVSAPSSSTAVMGSVDDTMLQQMRKVLQRLVAACALNVGSAQPLTLRANEVPADALDLFCRRGVLARARVEDAQPLYSVNPLFVSWNTCLAVHEPIPMIRVATDLQLLRKSKFELMITLRGEGWQPCSDDRGMDAYTRGGEKHFIASLVRPLAYFACLLLAQELFDKGVPEILHNGKATYYKCLLVLKVEHIPAFFAALPGLTTDEHFKSRLRSAGVVEDDPVEELGPLPIEDRPLPIQDDNEFHVRPAAMPLEEGWRRCIARAGPAGPEQKVYFDHYTSGSGGTQRGFARCTVCGVCRWRGRTTSRERYCAEMLAWSLDCERVHAKCKERHRGHQPTPADIAAVESVLLLEPF